jgi:hypothetical protein
MSSFVKSFEKWNKKLHFYLGLYLLFFLWLFSLTGLLLNHDKWATAVGANQRHETKYEQVLGSLDGDSDLERARNVMRQLDLRGEINWPASQQLGVFAFSISRPTDAAQIRIDLSTMSASVQHFNNSRMSAFRIFHTYSGSRYTDTARREWLLTSVWVVAMDAVASGLIVMVLGSYYMWFRLKPKRRLGVLVLAGGVMSCALFVAGLP